MKMKAQYYFTAIRLGLKSKTIYRASAWIGSVTGIFGLLIQVAIWYALLGAGARFDTTFQTMLTFSILMQLSNAFVATFSGDAISRLIRNGDIAIYMARPIKLKQHLFLGDFGRNLFAVFLVNLPVCIILILFYGFTIPPDWRTIAISIIMLINGMIILFHYRYILGLVSFWLIQNPFTSWGFQNVESIFSGRVLPIWLYPVWLADLTQYLPFRYFFYEPIALFVGKSTLGNSMNSLLIQCIWLVIFVALEKIASHFALRKLIVQGG
ncbi:MAG: ABC-2 family transporter protein [Oscillospiraceae bacterium]|nr:ABC-2 family transporter protein [Oscillospiraceae bacterium]